MTQKSKIGALKGPREENIFLGVRDSVQNIGVNSRPDVCANVKFIAPGNNPIKNAEKRTLSKTLAHMRESIADGLIFRPLDLTTARLVLIMHASFAKSIHYK